MSPLSNSVSFQTLSDDLVFLPSRRRTYSLGKIRLVPMTGDVKGELRYPRDYILAAANIAIGILEIFINY